MNADQPLLQKLGDALNGCQLIVDKIQATLADPAPA
ncbi:MAG: hypothetical protein FYV88_4930, partial [Bacteroidetes bacterium]|nr:hypothetical protein [Bacteroidota bacterium]